MSTSGPRSAEFPMAFTEREFMRGALWAWLAFLILLPLTLATSVVLWSTDPKTAFGGFIWGLTIGGFALIFAAPISLIVMALGTWPFRWVGRSLRRVRSFAAHILVYCALGVAFGTGTAFRHGHLVLSVGWRRHRLRGRCGDPGRMGDHRTPRPPRRPGTRRPTEGH
ncbi:MULTISPECIES: hypothetical protein [unclassified Microbacterium]|uniref:hypothetical protein n=1 Tax=unclassified Microbacterium TaxID=2609290 RepID=UPI0012F9284B|nr:hypothetical protein [Microbacterium sp. MAH-37]MVQ42980.1 hypothetical protein [Microbacterium sp. MAH-37]